MSSNQIPVICLVLLTLVILIATFWGKVFEGRNRSTTKPLPNISCEGSNRASKSIALGESSTVIGRDAEVYHKGKRGEK